MAYNSLKTFVQQYIKQNGNQEITGPVLQNVLLQMIESLGDGYLYTGIAEPSTNPGSPETQIFYVTKTPGTYIHFLDSNNSAIVVPQGISILKFNGTYWILDVVSRSGDLINVNDANNQSTAYASSVDARKAVPIELRKSGLQITYLSGGAWHTEQYIGSVADLTSANWSNNDNWSTILSDGEVGTDQLADDAVTTDKINDGAVTEDKIGSGAVTTDKVANSAITSAKINDGAVGTSKLGSKSVTNAKIDDHTISIDKIASSAFDSQPTESSGKLLSSGTIYNAIRTLLTTGYTFAGVADTSTTPGTPTQNVFYIGSVGSYSSTNWGANVDVPQGSLVIFYYDNAWHNVVLRTASDHYFNVNIYRNEPAQTYTALAARSYVPADLRKKGMIITYLTANGWITELCIDNSGTWTADASWQILGPVSVSQNILTIGNNPKYNIKSIFGTLSLALLDISNIVSRLSPGEFGLNTSTKKIYYKKDASNYEVYDVTKDGLYEYNGDYYRFDGTNIVKLPLYTPIINATNMLPKFDENGNLINSGQLLLNDGNLFLKNLGGYTGNGEYSGKNSINGVLRSVSYGLLRSLCCRHNGWIGLDGVLVDNSTYDYMYYSDLIPVKKGINIHYCLAQAAAKDSNNKYQYIWFYDVNGSFISALTADSVSSKQVGTITANDIPTDAYYFRFVLNTYTFEFAIGLDLGSFLPQDKEHLLATFKDDYDWQQGYVAQNTIATTYADAKYNNKLIPVVPNVTYRIDGTQENAYYVQIFNRERQRVRSVKASVSGSVTTMTLTILPNEFYIRLSYKLSSNKGLYIYQINGMADALAISLMEEEIAPLQCPIVYGRTLNANYYRFNNSLYAEGFASKQRKLLIDGGIESTPNQTQQNGDFLTPIKLTSGNTQEIISIRRKNKDVANVSGKAFVLCIGESTTQNAELNPKTGAWGDLWGWPSAMQYFNEIDKSDGGLCAIKTIGRHLINLMPNELQFQYKGRNLTNRSFNEGFSGWTSYGFLYWPCRVSIYPSSTRFGAETMWYALGLYTKTPFSQTNYNTTTEPYTGSDEQIALMTKTPFGFYKIDGNADVWNLIKYLGTQSEYPAFTGTGNYTGSNEQIALMQSWCDELGSNPINPFYSKTKARVSNTAIAFDLNLYLQWYRTCDDLGITLTGSAGQSVIGSDGLTYTIGTKVTDTTLYDVCTPTHIILNIGNNESAAGMNKVANAVSNIKDFVGLFNIPVGYFVTRHPGVLAKGLWDENYITKQYVLDAFVNEMVAALYEWFESQSGKYMLPIFQIQPPVSVTGEFFESGILKDKLNVSYDNIHPGWSAYKAIGFQCMSWLYNIL